MEVYGKNMEYQENDGLTNRLTYKLIRKRNWKDNKRN